MRKHLGKDGVLKVGEGAFVQRRKGLFACTTCGNECGNDDYMRRHIAGAHLGFLWPCNQCGGSFDNFWTFRDHQGCQAADRTYVWAAGPSTGPAPAPRPAQSLMPRSFSAQSDQPGFRAFMRNHGLRGDLNKNVLQLRELEGLRNAFNTFFLTAKPTTTWTTRRLVYAWIYRCLHPCRWHSTEENCDLNHDAVATKALCQLRTVSAL